MCNIPNCSLDSSVSVSYPHWKISIFNGTTSPSHLGSSSWCFHWFFPLSKLDSQPLPISCNFTPQYFVSVVKKTPSPSFHTLLPFGFRSLTWPRQTPPDLASGFFHPLPKQRFHHRVTLTVAVFIQNLPVADGTPPPLSYLRRVRNVANVFSPVW